MFSCKKDYNNGIINSKPFVINSFPKVKKLKGNRINVEILGMTKMAIVDTFLFGIDIMGRDGFIKVYSTNNFDSLGTVIAKGRGPNELLTLNYNGQYEIDSLGCHLWISDDALLSKTYSLNLTESLRQETTVFDTGYIFKNLPACSKYYLNDSTFVGFTFENFASKEYIVYDVDENRKMSNIKLFKKDFIDKEHYISHVFFQRIRPDKKFFVAPCVHLNQLHILDANLTEICTLHIGEKNMSVKKNMQKKDKERHVSYWDVAVTNEYIFALYANKRLIDIWEGNDSIGVEFHVFRWNGEPIASFKIKESINSICIDEKHKYLYGKTINEEIYRYDLKGVLY